MPLYEYECEGCGKRFELIRKFSDPPVERCFSCGGVVHKLLSSPAIQFKGTGWYITDYARKGSTSPGAADGEKASKDGTSASEQEKKTESTASPAPSSSSTAKE